MSTSSSTSSSSSFSTPRDLFPNPYLPNISQVHHFLSLKLTPTNYLFRKTQFLALLRSFDLLGLVNGTDICPSSTLPSPDGLPAPNPVHVSWTRHDQHLLSWIIASLSEEMLPQIISLSSLLTVWTALHQAFGAPSHTRILQLTLVASTRYNPPITVAACPLLPSPIYDEWYPNKGVTHHLTPTLRQLHISEPYQSTDQVQVGNGQGLGEDVDTNKSEKRRSRGEELQVPV